MRKSGSLNGPRASAHQERGELKISSRRCDSSMQRRHNRGGLAVGPLLPRLRCARRDRQNRDRLTTSASERRRGPESSSKSQAELMDVRASPKALQPTRRTSCLAAVGSKHVPPRWTEYHNIHWLKPKEECRLPMERASGVQQLAAQCYQQNRLGTAGG